MTMEVLFAGVPVAQLSPAAAWYEQVFGRPPDIVPNEHEVMWRVAGNGWMYVVEQAKGYGGALVTVSVDDLDRFVAGLAERGISTGPIEPVGDGGRKAVSVDPDGNLISWIEVVT